MFSGTTFLIIPNLLVEGAVPTGGAEEISVPAVQATPSIYQLVMQATTVVQGVLLLLVFMSVVTWGIVVAKWWQLRKAKSQTKMFFEVFDSTRNMSQISESSHVLTSSPVAGLFIAGYRELSQLLRTLASKREQSGFDQKDATDLDIDNVERALRRAKAEEVTRLESGTTFLATTASAAPFIGLFGTVWGIMHAFMGLSHATSTSIQAVAPGISEALIATAIGLAAAIPAAIAYNYFLQQVRVMGRDMDSFGAEFLNIARRSFLK